MTEMSAWQIPWTWPVFIIVPVVVTATLFAIGTARQKARVSARSVSCFVAGIIALVLALDSPIHELSEELFWAHMMQHEILMLVAAPLFVVSRPMVAFVWAIPKSWRARVGSVTKWHCFQDGWLAISAPGVAWLLHALALWLWHAPRLFVAALDSEALHAAQHISFFATALLFWWTLVHHHGRKLGYGGALLYVFTTMVHTSVLGAWLTFSASPWYYPYIKAASRWNLTAIEDQQIGGLIMWVPGGVLLTLVMLAIFLKWLEQSEQRWEFTRTADLIRSSAGVAREI